MTKRTRALIFSRCLTSIGKKLIANRGNEYSRKVPIIDVDSSPSKSSSEEANKDAADVTLLK